MSTRAALLRGASGEHSCSHATCQPICGRLTVTSKTLSLLAVEQHDVCSCASPSSAITLRPTASTSVPRCRSLCCVSTLRRGSSSSSGLLLYLSYLPGLNSSVRRSRCDDQPGTHACLNTSVGNYFRLGIAALDCCLPTYIIFVLQLVIIFIKYNTKLQAEEFVTRGGPSGI